MARSRSASAASRRAAPPAGDAAGAAGREWPQPVPRAYKFGLPASRVQDWDAHGKLSAAFANTLSLFFPRGEQFFIRAVARAVAAAPASGAGALPPRLAAAVRGFTRQEALHSREHDAYNDAVRASLGPLGRAGVDALDFAIAGVLGFFDAGPRALSLAGTVGLEHLTAALGHTLLSERGLLTGAEPRYRALWLWHAYEETEHKAVAYDVYAHVYGGGAGAVGAARNAAAWLLRVAAFVLAMVIFLAMFVPAFLAMAAAVGVVADPREWAALLTLHWAPQGKGMLRRIMPLLVDFVRPGFHPWQHDNESLLDEPLRELPPPTTHADSSKRE